MEFYYQHPNPELLKPLLRSFAEAGWLGHAEKRLSVAAFLAELAWHGQLDLARLARETADLGRDARLTLAWALHLANADNKKDSLENLLGAGDRRFASHIRQSPAGIRQWNLAAEPSVLGMYWSAFMACGNLAYVDAILDCALNLRNFELARRAAASLYEYEARHPLVEKKLRDRLKNATVNERERLETMLHH
ncbi:MAG: translation initiation factor 2 [Desulfovibrio sp.]|nr:translation initiation factor 2 [Desulfovibrio sp.]